MKLILFILFNKAIIYKGSLKVGVLRPFLSLFVLSLLACHGGKGREKGDKKGQKGTKRDKKGQKS